MDASMAYVAISIVALVIIALLVVFVRKKRGRKELTPLAGLAFGFILAGIIFGNDRSIGYGLLVAGGLLAVIDMIIKWKKK
ncbi:MAG: hypothetical protein V1776_00585 [Candidatus Diapherotrites archaeon]